MTVNPVILELAHQWLDDAHLFEVQMKRVLETMSAHTRVNKDLWNLCQKEGINMSDLLDNLRLDQ